MTKQPEALRLADVIDPLLCNEMSFHDFADAAIELRRLHGVNAELLAAISKTVEAALAQPEQTEQEPVANLTIAGGLVSVAAKILPDGIYDLYTSPPKREWVNLTDDAKQGWIVAMPDKPQPRHLMNLINVIEARLKETNT